MGFSFAHEQRDSALYMSTRDSALHEHMGFSLALWWFSHESGEVHSLISLCSSYIVPLAVYLCRPWQMATTGRVQIDSNTLCKMTRLREVNLPHSLPPPWRAIPRAIHTPFGQVHGPSHALCFQSVIHPCAHNYISHVV